MTKFRIIALVTVVTALSAVSSASAVQSSQVGSLTQSLDRVGCFDSYAITTPVCETSSTRLLARSTSLAVASSDDFIYATAIESGSVIGYKRDAATGGVTEVSGTSACIAAVSKVVNCAHTEGDELLNPQDLVTSPDADSKYVYAAAGTEGEGSVTSFRRNATTGALSEINCVSSDLDRTNCATLVPFQYGPEEAPFDPVAIVEDPSGRFVYVASASGNFNGTITAFKVEDDGSLSQLPPMNGCMANSESTHVSFIFNCSLTDSIASVEDLSISPDGKHLYAISSGGANTITSFDIGSDGALSPLDPGGPGECIDSDANIAYCQASQLGMLGQPTSVGLSKNGKYVLVTSSQFNGIVSLERDTDESSPTFGQLKELPRNSNGCWSSGSGAITAPFCQRAEGIESPSGFAVTDDGYLYVSSLGTSAVAEFRFDDHSGMIDQLERPDSCIADKTVNDSCQQLGRAMLRPVDLIASGDQRHVYSLGNNPAVMTRGSVSCSGTCDTPQIFNGGQIAVFSRVGPSPLPDPTDSDNPVTPQTSSVTTQGAAAVTGTPAVTGTSAPPTARCSLVASVSSVSRWRHLGGSTAIRLRTVSGGTFIRARNSGVITLDHRRLGGHRSARVKATFFIDGKKIATKKGKKLTLRIVTGKLSVGGHTMKVKVRGAGTKATLTRSFAVRDCRPTRFSVSMSSLLRRAHPNLRFWLQGSFTSGKFKLAKAVKLDKAKLRGALRGKTIGRLVAIANGRAVTSKLTVPSKVSGKSVVLNGALSLSLGSTPALLLKNLPTGTSEVTIELFGTKNRLFRNANSCKSLNYVAKLRDEETQLTLERGRKLCSNRR